MSHKMALGIEPEFMYWGANKSKVITPLNINVFSIIYYCYTTNVIIEGETWVWMDLGDLIGMVSVSLLDEHFVSFKFDQDLKKNLSTTFVIVKMQKKMIT